jgi:hypothetical protein
MSSVSAREVEIASKKTETLRSDFYGFSFAVV